MREKGFCYVSISIGPVCNAASMPILCCHLSCQTVTINDEVTTYFHHLVFVTSISEALSSGVLSKEKFNEGETGFIL